MERQSEDGLSATGKVQRENRGAAKQQRKKKPYTSKTQKHDNNIATAEQEKLPAIAAALPNIMLLRLTYWLNRTYNKTVNTGMYGFRHDTAIEPCVLLASTDRKLLVITHDEWKRMLPYFNDVTVCFNNKQIKTIFVPGEDCIAFGFTIKFTFGKPHVTLFRLDDTNEEHYSPFGMTESEWNTLIIHAPTINRYLDRLQNSSDSYKYVRGSLTTDLPPTEGNDDTYLRLANELYAVRNFRPSM